MKKLFLCIRCLVTKRIETPALLDTEAEYIKFQKERKKYEICEEDGAKAS